MSDSSVDAVPMVDRVRRDFERTVRFIQTNVQSDTPTRVVLIQRGRKNTSMARSSLASNSSAVDDSAEKTQAHLHQLTRGMDHVHSNEYDKWQLGICCSNHILDVDYDGNSSLMSQALQEFLPFTPHKWGRPEKWTTHWLFHCPDDPTTTSGGKILQRIQRIPELATEIRFANNPNIQTVLPGAVTPKSDSTTVSPVLWVGNETVEVSLKSVRYDQIFVAIRMAAASALMAKYWTEGSRHHLLKAFAGFLGRLSATTDDLGIETWLDESAAWRICHATMTLGQDEEANTQQRKQTFKQSWDKAKAGKEVTGATTLIELTGDESVRRHLYSILSDDPDIEVAENFYNRFVKWITYGKVIDLDAIAKNRKKYVMTTQQFKDSHSNIHVKKFENGKVKNIVLASQFFHMNNVFEVDEISCRPERSERIFTERGVVHLNAWTGFAIPPWPEPVTKEDIPFFWTQIYDIIASGDDKIVNWVMSWIAHIFQKPAERKGTSLVLVGLPGAGKTSLGEQILSEIIGPAHSTATNSMQKIVHNFNVKFENKILVRCDEAMHSRQEATANRLKSLMTDRVMEIERKGVDAHDTDNHIRFLFTSNRIEDAVAITDGEYDRRYTVIKVSPKYVGKIEEFWIPYSQWCKNRDNLSKVHRFLLDWKIDEAAISRPLDTEARKIVQQHSSSLFIKWLVEKVQNDCFIGRKFREEENRWWSAVHKEHKKNAYVDDGWPEYIHFATAVKDYNAFVEKYDRNQHAHKTEAQLIEALRGEELMPQDAPRLVIRDGQARRKLRKIYSKNDFIFLLNDKYGQNIEYDNPEKEEYEEGLEEPTKSDTEKF